MPISEDVHFQIIRIAVGYSLLGVFVITAFVCLLSFIQIPSQRSSKNAKPRPLVIIDPPWFRKSLYSSLVVQIVVTAALFWQSLLTVDTTHTARQVQTTVEKQGIEAASDDIKGVGILRYWRRSNDFLPYIREAIAKACRRFGYPALVFI
jgi:heme/copper-type cytochrome/quinol oxidase subunit 2